jgi:thioredoxin reductase
MNMAETAQDLDVLIIGGGPAGLAAALCLGRSRRRVVVLDVGAPRHAISAEVHNFLTRDGLPPAELRTIAWQQMAAYPSVTHHRSPEPIVRLERERDHWIATDAAGASWRARAVLLATGVIDQHPDIDGYEQRWGHSIHLCPFCHGWELRDQPLAVLSSLGEHAAHMGRLLRAWSDDVVVLTHGATLDPAHEQALRDANIPIYTQHVTRLSGPGRSLDTIHLADGTSLTRRGIFAGVTQRQVPLVASLGLDTDEHGYIRVDLQQRTSLPMLWAAGDLTSRLQQVIEAAAQGNRAGALIHATLTLTPT